MIIPTVQSQGKSGPQRDRARTYGREGRVFGHDKLLPQKQILTLPRTPYPGQARFCARWLPRLPKPAYRIASRKWRFAKGDAAATASRQCQNQARGICPGYRGFTPAGRRAGSQVPELIGAKMGRTKSQPTPAAYALMVGRGMAELRNPPTPHSPATTEAPLPPGKPGIPGPRTRRGECRCHSKLDRSAGVDRTGRPLAS